jgi:two-component system, OmpR family, KDP operon response regulator KdpE
MPNPSARIVIIEDDYAVRRLLQTSLEGRGYRVATAATGQHGLTTVATEAPQVILLDLGLPDMDGVTVITQLRTWATTPIVVLSARHEEQQKVAALDAGADDYLTKPFSTEELLARIRVALRHQDHRVDAVSRVQIGDLTLDLVARQVRVGATEIRLTPTEYHLLHLFAINPGRVLTHGMLLRTVWGPGYHQDTQLLRGFIAQLRHKIEPDPRRPHYLLTEPGIGYRLADHGVPES